MNFFPFFLISFKENCKLINNRWLIAIFDNIIILPTMQKTLYFRLLYNN